MLAITNLNGVVTGAHIDKGKLGINESIVAEITQS
jgi:hypothetical protein